YYDHKGFKEYPTRQGYSQQDLRGVNDFGGRNAEDVKQFFQTWLFFGLVVEFFAAFGVQVTTEQFLRPDNAGGKHQILDTSKLPDLLAGLKGSWTKPHDKPTETAVAEILTRAQDT